MRPDQYRVSGITVLVAFCVVLMFLSSAAIVFADGDADLSIVGATETPTETVTANGGEYTIDGIAVVDPGESITADVSVADGNYTRATFEIINSDEQLVDDFDGDSIADPQGSEQITLSPGFEYDAGTYSLNVYLEDEAGRTSLEDIHPVVVAGYDVSVEDPGEVTAGNETTVTASVTPTVRSDPPAAVEAVVWNDSTTKRFDATATNDSEYTATIDTEGLDTGEYQVYVVARGTEEFRGERELLGLGESDPLDVITADSGNGDDSPDEDSDSQGPSGPAGPSGPSSSPGQTNPTNETTGSDSTNVSHTNSTDSEPGMNGSTQNTSDVVENSTIANQSDGATPGTDGGATEDPNTNDGSSSDGDIQFPSEDPANGDNASAPGVVPEDQPLPVWPAIIAIGGVIAYRLRYR